MRTFTKVIMMFSSLWLFSSGALANNTGKLCKAHLAPITQIIQPKYVKHWWELNDEITNVLGTSLGEISTVKSNNSLVQGFANLAKTTVENCQKHCGGIAMKTYQKIQCHKLAEMDIMSLNQMIDKIEDDYVADSGKKSDVDSNPECAFKSSSPECQIADNKQPEGEAEAKEPETSEPEVINPTVKSLDEVYQTYADELNSQQRSQQQKEDSQAVW